MAGDWVKLYRKTLHSAVMRDSVMAHLFLWCLCRANYRPAQWLGVPLAAGQFAFGRSAAAIETNLKPSTFYGGMKRLEACGFLTLSANSRFTIVTICNWGTYQEEKDDGRQMAGAPPTDGRRAAGAPPTQIKKERTKEEKKETTPGGENFADEAQPPRLPAVVYYSAGQAAMVPIPDSLNTPAFREFWLNTWIPHRTAKDGGREPTTYEMMEQLSDLSAGTVEQALARMRKSIKCGWKMLAEPETTKANGKPLGSIPADLFRKIR